MIIVESLQTNPHNCNDWLAYFDTQYLPLYLKMPYVLESAQIVILDGTAHI